LAIKGVLFTVFICLPSICLANANIQRKVLVLYNSETSQTPMRNIGFSSCQTILNYYGILTDYRDVSQRPLPDPETMSAYRGIITVFNSTDMQGAIEYLTWQNNQFKADKKIIVLGNMGGSANRKNNPILKNLIDKSFRYLGLEYEKDFTANQTLLRYVYKDKERVEFERNYPFFPTIYEKYTPIHNKVKTYTSIKRIDRKNSLSSTVITSPTGGFAKGSFMLWEGSYYL